MIQNKFVLIHQDGQYLSINEGSHWITVRESAAATILSEVKANNILQNMIKPREREFWRLQPLSEAASDAQVTEVLPQEEVPAFEEPSEQKPAESKPAETSPAGKQPAEKKAAKSSAKKPEEKKTAGKKPAEQKKTSGKKAEKAEASAKPAESPAPAKAAEEKKPAPKKIVKPHASEQPARVVPAKAHPHSSPKEVPAEEGSVSMIDAWVERAEAMKQEYDRLIQRKKDLAEQLRQVSAELCDLEHYIEFHSLNAVKGYQVYRQLRECLIRRRNIKDELMCITIYLKAEPHNIQNGNLVRQFSGLRTREYAPRVLHELFQEKKD